MKGILLISLAIAFVSLNLTSCLNQQESRLPTERVEPPPCPPHQTSAKSPRIAVRGYLHHDEVPPTGLGAYGYLIFTSRPSEATQARYEEVCRAYIRNLEEFDDYHKYAASLRSYMITYWLLAKEANTQDWKPIYEQADCQQLVLEYDYVKASLIAHVISKHYVAGPILVAWDQPFNEESPPKNALILDMSNFEDLDLDRALRIWKKRISRDPSVWRRGFSLVKAREAFRSFIQKYGEHIVAVIKG